MNVIKNGLYLDLNFKGALHLSTNAGDKLVVNINTTERGTWVDMIVIYHMVDETFENFRIGGHIDPSLTGHKDLYKWLEYCFKEQDWEGSIGCLNKDALILGIFNFINGVSDTIITEDTRYKIENEDGFRIETFYPWPEDEDYNLEEDDEIIEEVVEEVIEEVVEKTSEEIINFENYEFVGVHERGGNKRSDKYIDKRVGSIIYVVTETDEDGVDHFIGGDVLKASKSLYSGPSRVVSIYNLDDVNRVRQDADDVIERIIKASDLNLQAEIDIAEVVLKIDIEKLLDKIQEGLEWKASQTSDSK